MMARGSFSIDVSAREICEGGYGVRLNGRGKTMPIKCVMNDGSEVRDGPYHWARHYVYWTDGNEPDRAIIVGIATNPEAARRVIDEDKTARAIDILTGVT